jgi:hypothetical protein
VRTVTGSTVRVDLSRAPRGERHRRADGRPGAWPGPLALVVVAAFALITFLKGQDHARDRQRAQGEVGWPA